jgi:ATP-dependent protease ClpP protease subunit
VAARTTEDEPANKRDRSVNYIRKHWRGELSLAVSYWINLVLLNIAVTLLSVFFSSGGIIENPVIAARVVIILCAFNLLIIYPWQIIGLWRSCGNHIEESGKRFWPRTAQVFVVLGFILMLGRLETSWPIYKDFFHMGFQKDEWGNYTLKLEKNNTLIHLQGGLGFGVSKDISKLLNKYPEVKGIILDSSGGRIYEGRKLADLISAYGLDTYSLEGCHSAATTAFIAGKNRFLGIGANLAFHQYKAGYKSMDGLVEMEDEQAKDLLIFQQQGIKGEFLDKLFIARNQDFWYPTIDEMLDAGVIHGIIQPSDLLPVEHVFSAEDFDEAILDPIFKTIRQYEPDTYRKFMAEFEEQIKKGATPIELQHECARVVRSLAFAMLPQTSDEALIQYTQAIVGRLKKLKDIDPILGMKMLYPQQYGPVDFSKYSSDREYSPLGLMDKVIIDVYEQENPVVDAETAEILLAALRLELGEYADRITAGILLRYLFSQG